jgi:hypothetical protein
MQVTEPIATRAPEPDWSGWENWLRSHLDIEREVTIEAFGEALGLTCQELRDRISALELKLAELTGASISCAARRRRPNATLVRSASCSQPNAESLVICSNEEREGSKSSSRS